MSGITLIGLGPGAPSQITLEAQELLTNESEIWVTSRAHPVIAALPDSTRVRVLPAANGGSPADPAGDAENLAEVMKLSKRSQGVLLALPGHPLIDSTLGAAVWHRAVEMGISARLVSAPSQLDGLIAVLPEEGSARVFICMASSLEGAHIPPFPPDAPALITGIPTRASCQVIQRVLQSVYRPEHHILFFPGSPGAQGIPMSLAELAPSKLAVSDASLYVPPLTPGSSLESLQEVIAHLRAPEGCPWDRKQTHASLRPHLLEEAYEALQAMDSDDPAAMREEFGDLMLQIMLNSQIAAEAGNFTLNDVARAIHDKLIRRHPHVFGELQLEDVDGVLSNWEKLKEGERALKGASAGLLDGVPSALPALSQGQEYQDRAARVGFDWPEIDGVLAKIAEEIGEVQAAEDARALESELGDLLFSLVNYSRWKGIDAEAALRAANQRFRRRFSHIEAAAQRQGRRLSELSLQEMDAFWNQAKSSDPPGPAGP